MTGARADHPLAPELAIQILPTRRAGSSRWLQTFRTDGLRLSVARLQASRSDARRAQLPGRASNRHFDVTRRTGEGASRGPPAPLDGLERALSTDSARRCRQGRSGVYVSI